MGWGVYICYEDADALPHQMTSWHGMTRPQKGWTVCVFVHQVIRPVPGRVRIHKPLLRSESASVRIQTVEFEQGNTPSSPIRPSILPELSIIECG